ncbi:hypothetical protein IGI49_004669 [Enterococcus sp. AZ071]
MNKYINQGKYGGELFMEFKVNKRVLTDEFVPKKGDILIFNNQLYLLGVSQFHTG